jgi:NADP-dependent 3-hydroxy acid dehydrogenase YdfG
MMQTVKPVVLITGASRGIGEAIAHALAQTGDYTLALSARSTEALNTLKQTLQAEYPLLKVAVFPCDVALPESPQWLIEAVHKQLGRLDVLINNAGVGGKVGLITEMPDAQLHAMVDLNLKAPMLLTKYALQAMLNQPAIAGRGMGTIININSIAGKTAFPFWAVYDATKAGLKAFADALCEEQRSNGVRVVGIYPGACDTAIWETLDLAADDTPDKTGFLRPAQVAEAVLFALQQPAGTLVSDITLMPTTPAV